MKFAGYVLVAVLVNATLFGYLAVTAESAVADRVVSYVCGHDGCKDKGRVRTYDEGVPRERKCPTCGNRMNSSVAGKKTTHSYVCTKDGCKNKGQVFTFEETVPKEHKCPACKSRLTLKR
jgi:transcription initiation factor IIE alpha subunit